MTKHMTTKFDTESGMFKLRSDPLAEAADGVLVATKETRRHFTYSSLERLV